MDDSSNIEKFWIKNIDEKRTGFNEIVVENKIKNFEILKIFFDRRFRFYWRSNAYCKEIVFGNENYAFNQR